MNDRVTIRRLATGIPGLDEVLGGGLPEFSFNLIAGGPGCGKTTMAHQFMFANASQERKALYFTVFGEPPLKMLRYQQQFSFFDASKLDGVVRFMHLGKELEEGGLPKVLERVIQEVEASSPGIVVVDSFRSLARHAIGTEDALGLDRFVQLLALTLTSYEATTFLVGEYREEENASNPVFTVADGIVWLRQSVARNSVVRQLQAVKMRGQEPSPGLHTLKLSADGLRVFPRLPMPVETVRVAGGVEERKKTGVPGLDAMLHGGIPAGYSLMVAGPSGSGKSILSTQFILEGARAGERGVIVLFEKRPADYLRTSSRERELDRLTREGRIKLIYLRPLDLSVDETMEQVRSEVSALGATRVVIDSLSGFELALAPTFRDDFRESIYRMVGALTALGATVVLTAEVVDSFTELRLSQHGISFLTDGIVLQRYIELEGCLRKAIVVVKLRASSHAKELRTYEISDGGIVVGEALTDYRGLLTGRPAPLAPPRKRRTARKPRR